jgi:hypothetical protein
MTCTWTIPLAPCFKKGAKNRVRDLRQHHSRFAEGGRAVLHTTRRRMERCMLDPEDAYDDLVRTVEHKLARAFVGRDQQIRTLIRLLGQVRPPPSL